MIKKMLTVILCFVLVLSLASCGGDSIATVDGENIDKGYFEYYFNQLKLQLENEIGEESWETAQYEGKTALEYAKERALQSAIEDSIVNYKAKEGNIRLSSDDIKQMGQLKQQWIMYSGGQEAFSQLIKSYGINENQFDYMMETDYLRSHLIDKFSTATDEEAKAYYDENIVKVKHILVFTIDPATGAKLPDADLKAAQLQADELLKKAKNGENFDALVAEYTEDQDVFYYLGEGYSLAEDGTESTGMVPEFETASMALKVDEISDLVESQYGYHIIKRYANDDEMFEKSKNTMLVKVKTNKFTDVINGWKAEMKIVVNESLYNSYK